MLISPFFFLIGLFKETTYSSDILSSDHRFGPDSTRKRTAVRFSYIYEPARIHLKNEATFGFDQGWDLFFMGRMNLRTGNFADELLNFLDFWRGRDRSH